MLKFALKLTLVAVLGFGTYFYFNQAQFNNLVHRSPKKEVINIAEVGYQETPEWQLANETVISEPVLVNGETQTFPEIKIVTEETPGAIGETVVDDAPIMVEETVQIPEEYKLAVPFTSQAPHSNWALPYQETCEEASIYMVSEYYKGTLSGVINADTADTNILEIVAFEKDFLGDYLDTTAGETSRLIDSFYGYGAVVVENPSIEQIKTEIASGHPVIVPSAGQLLGNPNFVGQGPLYHMFVIKGYTKDKFITNDPGTRNGESYIYNISTIMNAIHDWNGGDPVNGQKRVIFTSNFLN
ncbi:hypothetical protein COY25_04625 [Candidatus Uhrbacteria bacterium CG_4_10_14_0_2_um_filter_41_7]|uniref:Peptidase C39-like domain-containing protein n=1 Tax=Candidatus Uhrbacteria bacterium CG_4_9_14_3_um_filter_41_35 TaxID=1975034 RepID=A0A2M7XFN4_9BACT|nr:MAG: hypothetical protein COV92_01400 [Candidatus Uhrbacteria bacterium CG11_big_fil_rev_8_21_14_0_20_41_9]PIZ52738.1 MAG: hypothetical protein COY25_04625 [Candidatus Uhrbacteria bacterium CG_4_10_14_0_2_um_filter_41_7]PJA46669.1 MAG: hypothetical protein CO173_02780 [Candidatus Uhrbacteria bacterium CG_4_9_14_3_um_filter_41_35]